MHWAGFPVLGVMAAFATYGAMAFVPDKDATSRRTDRDVATILAIHGAVLAAAAFGAWGLLVAFSYFPLCAILGRIFHRA